MESLSGLYLVISSSRVMRRMAGHSSFFRPKNSKMRWLSSMSLSMKMNRIWGWRAGRRQKHSLFVECTNVSFYDSTHTLPLNPSAAFLNWSILSWKSEEPLGRNMRMWDLMSPPKILGAVCRRGKKNGLDYRVPHMGKLMGNLTLVITWSVNSMTRGSWLLLTNAMRFSLVTSPSKVLRPSSNC